jgi:hypothetical protein
MWILTAATCAGITREAVETIKSFAYIIVRNLKFRFVQVIMSLTEYLKFLALYTITIIWLRAKFKFLHWLSIEYICPGRKFELGNNLVVGIFKRHCPDEDMDLNCQSNIKLYFKVWKTHVILGVNNKVLNEFILQFE